MAVGVTIEDGVIVIVGVAEGIEVIVGVIEGIVTGVGVGVGVGEGSNIFISTHPANATADTMITVANNTKWH